MTKPGVSLALAAAIAAPAGAMTISSPDLRPGAAFAAPQMHQGCGGTDVSPALAWSGQPPRTRSLALTMIDQDAKPAKWTHWILVNLPPHAGGLPRGVRTAPAPARAIRNGMGTDSYAGPCPPPDSGVHHYEITVWALSGPPPAIGPDAKPARLERLLRGVAIDHATLVGTAVR